MREGRWMYIEEDSGVFELGAVEKLVDRGDSQIIPVPILQV